MCSFYAPRLASRVMGRGPGTALPPWRAGRPTGNSVIQGLEIGLIHRTYGDSEASEARADFVSRETRLLLEDTNQKIMPLSEGHGETVSNLGKLERMDRTLDNVKPDMEAIRTVVSGPRRISSSLKRLNPLL